MFDLLYLLIEAFRRAGILNAATYDRVLRELIPLWNERFGDTKTREDFPN